MTKLNLLKKIIYEIQEEVSDNIKNVNSGGCGWFSYFMTIELRKYDIISNINILEPEYVDITDKKTTLNNIINNNIVDDEECRKTSFAHCCISIGKFNFDGIKLNPIERWEERGYLICGLYTEEEMAVALEIGGWNSMYDVSQNTELKKIIQYNLKKLIE